MAGAFGLKVISACLFVLFHCSLLQAQSSHFHIGDFDSRATGQNSTSQSQNSLEFRASFANTTREIDRESKNRTHFSNQEKLRYGQADD